MAISSRNKISVQFSMSGMTDIVFLLLIFFMLTSTLIAPNALNLLLPRSNSQTTQNDEKLVVSVEPLLNQAGNFVDPNHRVNYYITDSRGDTRVNMQELEDEILRRKRTNDKLILAIHADQLVPIDNIVQLMNIAKNNQCTVILATAPE
ncbi:MAG: biopolymer transporter ExbD [Bacteroidales bacterium]|nr:biopolymer transporter ExbD [Bacteroidales bacterium]